MSFFLCCVLIMFRLYCNALYFNSVLLPLGVIQIDYVCIRYMPSLDLTSIKASLLCFQFQHQTDRFKAIRQNLVFINNEKDQNITITQNLAGGSHNQKMNNSKMH